MFCITIEHKNSCNTFFSIYCKNITTFLYWALWKCLATSIKKDNASLWKTWSLFPCEKWTPSQNEVVFLFFFFFFFFWDTMKVLQTCYFKYFDNAWPCPSILIVSPCRKLWWEKCWNQLLGKFDVDLYAKNQLCHSFFFRYCKEIAKGAFSHYDCG